MPIDEILATINLDPEVARDVDGHIPHNQFCKLWQEFVHRSGNPCIGLSLVEFAQPATFDVLGYTANSSANVGEALTRLAQYVQLLHAGAAVAFELETQVARVTHTLTESLMPPPAAFNQWVVANIVLFLRRATGMDWAPLRVRFQHTQPDDMSAYH